MQEQIMKLAQDADLTILYPLSPDEDMAKWMENLIQEVADFSNEVYNRRQQKKTDYPEIGLVLIDWDEIVKVLRRANKTYKWPGAKSTLARIVIILKIGPDVNAYIYRNEEGRLVKWDHSKISQL